MGVDLMGIYSVEVDLHGHNLAYILLHREAV